MRGFKMCTVGEKKLVNSYLDSLKYVCSAPKFPFSHVLPHVRTSAYMLARGVLVPMHIVLIGIQATCLNHYYTSFFYCSEGAMVKLSQVRFVQTMIRASHWIYSKIYGNDTGGYQKAISSFN